MQRRKIAIKLDKIYLTNSSFGEADIFSPFDKKIVHLETINFFYILYYQALELLLD